MSLSIRLCSAFKREYKGYRLLTYILQKDLYFLGLGLKMCPRALAAAVSAERLRPAGQLELFITSLVETPPFQSVS